MSKVNPEDSLSASIAALEQKKDAEFQSLKEQLRETGQSLKPANLIKSALHDVAASSQLKSLLIKTAIGLAVGYVVKRLITKTQKTNKKQILGNAMQYGISYLASNQNTLLRTAGITIATALITAIKDRRAKRTHANGEDNVNN